MSALAGRIATTLSALLLTVSGCPLPAQAARAGATITAGLPRLTLAPYDPDDETRVAVLWAVIEAADKPSMETVRYTVDYSGVAGFVDMTLSQAYMAGVESPAETIRSAPPDSGCQTRSQKITCTFRTWTGSTRPVPWLAEFNVVPKASAVVGDSGSVKVTASIGGGAENTTESLVRIGEGVNLAAATIDPIDVTAGQDTEVDVRIRNAGTTAAEGLALYLGVPREALATTSYRNCRYGQGVLCTFDTTLTPGATYALTEPLTVRTPADSITGSRLEAGLHWLPLTEWEDMLTSFEADQVLGESKPGTGAELPLTEVVGAAGDPQVETDWEDNYTPLTLTVADGSDADLVAIGDEVDAKAGGEATVRVGVLNKGPGRLHPDLFENNAVPIRIALPPNTSLRSGGDDCPLGDHDRVVCFSRSGLGPGRRELVELTLDVEKRPGRPGSVEITELAENTDMDDNKAELIVNVAAGDENLPITGPAGLLALGAFLLVAGGLGRYLTRRQS
jgi:hypothetical protein